MGDSGLGCSCAQPALWFFQSSQCWYSWYRVPPPGTLRCCWAPWVATACADWGAMGRSPPLLPRLVEGHREMTFHKIMGSFRLENPSK